MKTLQIPTAVEANRIQKLWMEFDSNSPREEINRICKVYEEGLPKSYIATSDSGASSVMVNGQPASSHNYTVIESEALAVKLGIQTQLRWNTKGFWYEAYDA